ncbi:ThiJ/PfpI domain-containing protein [Natrinema pellirubrum DSM 15624]|uniref:ThiJ/PfpI domain-containing protein n=1 Tax=Natrinema pellirubrum (strain DSM 15624 / CIP 106293 / JCM 10476 / NCIMB 786 / 157) TaxID=797303 RepID=L0JFS2_NATP1|nr:DJ-1/PfpI family protein [Natrinema pellirubrum]AGB30154.1 transcriptional regulator containing an amidase domain and an AraC-type DNA-binding HTH domain [Natrinema pellirubrum DSM 15624]ELY69860.1 ThiJ/PfpI domain-containing protein [Natrinema pellirubrum DSM 15624]
MADIAAEIVLFDGFDELDAVGPYEVLRNGARAGASLETRLVSLAETDLVRASHDLRLEPDGTLGEPDLLLVPGGGWTTEGGVRAAVEDGALPEAVRERYDDGATIASVCTGAMVLSAAGILEGRPAATHPVAVDDLAATAATVVDERVVDDGDVVTAGGVTSGIDLALWLLEREFGVEIAEAVAAEMAHERRGDVFESS